LRRLKSILLLSAALFAASAPGSAQTNSPTPAAGAGRDENWREFEPKGGGFKVLLPAKPKHEEKDGDLFSDRWRVETNQGGGPVRFAVMYAVVLTTNPQPAGAHDMLRAVRDAVVSELKRQPITDSAVTFDGKPGRLIEFAPEGTAHTRLLLIANGPLVYRLEATTPTDSEAERLAAAKFFKSFSLVQARPEAAGEVDKLILEGWLKEGRGGADAGLLDAKAIKKPAPAYTLIAKRSRASGNVRVKIAVDETGKVVAAQAMWGHPLLTGSAVEAARQARFTPTLAADGKPARVIGFITYNFVLW
jgi:TonB family protein